ncbi:MAG: co-chaperone GroES [Candidatus Woesearchaeota archaeon]
MNVKPLGNRVLLEREQVEEKTKGGIYIPDTAKEKTYRGKIVAVGDGKDIPVKAGDHVIFESYAGTEINIEDKKYLVMDIKDILAVWG